MLQYSEVSDFIEKSQFDQDSPNVIITSGNDSIGFQILKSLSQDGANIIFGGLNQSENERNMAKVSNASSNSSVRCCPLDLTKKSSIEDFVSYVRKNFQNGHIDILLNNADLQEAQSNLSQLNVDKIMEANCFGHFYLTHLLFDMLSKSKEARIINFSNMAYRNVQSANTLSNIHHNQKSYNNWDQYAKSKLANVQLTVSLAKKLRERDYNIKAVALYPGVYRKRIGEDDDGIIGKVINFMSCLRESKNRCAQTPIYLSKVQFKKLKSGQYYNEAKRLEELTEQARNIKSSEELWKFAQNLYNIKFNI